MKTLSIGVIGLLFQYHSHTHIIRYQLWPFWAHLDRNLTSSTLIFAAAYFMPKTRVKIVWHEPNDMLATSLIVIGRLFKILCFTASMFSSVVALRGKPGQASSCKSFWLILTRIYHNWTSILLIVDSPNTAVNILNALAH